MQSMLMVAALECTRGGYGQDHLYDEFIRNNRGSLVGFNDAIKMYYMRAYGPVGGRDAYDHFTTALANRHASRASGNGEFCRNSETLLRLALDARPGELVALASDVEERPFGVGATCGERFEPAGPPVMDAPAPAATWRTQDGDSRAAYAETPVADLADATPPPPTYRAYDQARDGDAVSRIDPPSAPPAREDPAFGRDAAALPAVAVAVMPSAAVSASAPINASPFVAVAEPTAAPLASIAPPVVETKAVAVAPVAGPSPAAALAAAAQALQAAAEALKASAVEAPVDAAPVIRERAQPARKL